LAQVKLDSGWAAQVMMPWLQQASVMRGMALVLQTVTLLYSIDRATCQGQTFDIYGLLGEYFTPLPAGSHCDGGNGSTNAFDGLLPTHTQRDESLDIRFTSQFRDAMPRCAWQRNTQGRLTHLCRATDDHLRTFAVRWSGYLLIDSAGEYTFSLAATDGARIVLGHTDQCPGVTCAQRFDTENSKLKDLSATADNNDGTKGTYMQQCPLCAAGNYDYCWVSQQGCQPFALWQLEADGGLSGTCGSGGQVFTGSRWFSSGYHAIRIEYFKRDEGTEATLSIQYSGPDTGNTMRSFPRNKLYFPNGMGLRSEWFSFGPDLNQLPNLGGPDAVAGTLLKREDDLLWDNVAELGRPFDAAVASYGTSIAVRWMGFFNINKGGTYSFRLESDDGSRFVLGGRGSDYERVIVDNDGVHGPAAVTENTVDLLPGLHTCRLEYFYQLTDEGEGAVPKPEGISLTYKGPDSVTLTGVEIWRPVAEQYSSKFQISDPDCPFSNLAFNNGMSQPRACDGTCFAGREGSVGDGLCDCPLEATDDGSIQCQANNFPRYYLQCAPFENDAGDCEALSTVTTTTTRARVQCLETCPPGNYMRHDCSSCPEGSHNGLCIKTLPDAADCANPQECTFLQCCAAFISGVPFWGRTCISFGTTGNCSLDWPGRLDALQNAAPDLYYQAAGWSMAGISGSLETYIHPLDGIEQEGCDTDLCNPVPPDMVPHPITQLPTSEPVCLVDESDLQGLECFEGPWDEIDIDDPLTECQDFRYNFCLNRRTWHGMPFIRCCAITSVLDVGGQSCMFRGIPAGTCEDYKDAWLAVAPGVSSAFVVGECFADRCNDPLNEVYECGAVVDEDPPETYGVKPPAEEVAPLEKLLVDAPAGKEDGPDLALILGISGTLTAGLLVTMCVIYRSCQKDEEPLWHSSAATVVTKDTFIEPTTDLEYNEGYNTVKPRPEALKVLEAKDRRMKTPKVLQEGRAVQPEVLALPPLQDDPETTNVHAIGFEMVLADTALRETAASAFFSEQASVAESVVPRSLPGEVPAVALPALPPPVDDEIVEEPEPTPTQEIQAALQVQRVAAPVAKVRSRPAAAARLEREAASQPHNMARWVVR